MKMTYTENPLATREELDEAQEVAFVGADRVRREGAFAFEMSEEADDQSPHCAFHSPSAASARRA